MKPRHFLITAVMLALAGSLIYCGSADSSGADKKEVAAKSERLPKMLDLGSKSCIPCKAMAPILDSLRQEYEGRAEIIFIDTKENRQAAIDHKITLIPTQIFFDPNGVEKFRHVGFYPADSIVTHLKALGVK